MLHYRVVLPKSLKLAEHCPVAVNTRLIGQFPHTK